MTRRRAPVPTTDTRSLLLDTAERLFAERGVATVSTREIGKAAGQANKSVVGYHFGTREDLVLAIAQRHSADIEQRRGALLSVRRASEGLAPWLSVLVEPITAHLASLGAPSFYARFLAHCMPDPQLHALVFADAMTSAAMRRAMREVNARLPSLPGPVFEARAAMTQHVIAHSCADHERMLARRPPYALEQSWAELSGFLVDALVGLWRAPSRTLRQPKKR